MASEQINTQGFLCIFIFLDERKEGAHLLALLDCSDVPAPCSGFWAFWGISVDHPQDSGGFSRCSFLPSSPPSLQILFLSYTILFPVPLHPLFLECANPHYRNAMYQYFIRTPESIKQQATFSSLVGKCRAQISESVDSVWCSGDCLEERREKPIFWGVGKVKRWQSSTLAQAHSRPAYLNSNIWTTRLIFP